MARPRLARGPRPGRGLRSLPSERATAFVSGSTPPACTTQGMRTTASAPRPTSRRLARRRSVRAARRSIRAPVAIWIPRDARARVEAGEPAALRFRVPAEDAVTFTDVVRGPITTDIGMIGDFVLLRQNGLPAYNFAVVVDDVAMGISLVVRGEDHVPNTPRQCLIYRALGESPAPVRPSRPRPRSRPCAAVQASRRLECGRVPGPRRPARGSAATTSPCSDGRPATTMKSCRWRNWRNGFVWRM